VSVWRNIASLRKLGHFLAALFPPLARLWDRLAAAARRRLEGPLARLATPRGRAVADLVRQFFWNDYKSDRADLDRLGAEGAALLRPVFLASVACCIALPLAIAAPGPSLPASAVDGATQPVAIASVLLWLVAVPLGWGALVAGAAGANRVALVVALAPYLYFACLSAIGLPPSLANVFAPVATLVAAAAAERRLGVDTRIDRARGACACGLVGVGAGIAVTAFTSLGNPAHGHRLLAGALLGVPLGALAWATGRRRVAPEGARGPSLPRIATAVAALTFVQFALVVARGGLAQFADNSTMFFRLFVGYLWPGWYFVGVGVIFGLLKTARTLTSAARILLPERWLTVLGLLVLAGAAVVFGARSTGGWLTTVHAPDWALLDALAVRHWSARWLFTQPAAILAAEWMAWVVVFDVVAVAWLVVRRRLSTAPLAWLASHTLLAWLVVYEYFWQQAGFTRSSSHSAILLGTFAVWLLWLLHKLTLRLGRDSSPRWPSTARLAVGGGVLLLVLASVEARAAFGDARLSDEIFLYLFRGVIDVGLPYFLFVYAGRRLRALPLETPQVLGAFCLGAALVLPLSALDHWVAAGSLPALSAELDRRAQALLTTGALPPIETVAPMGWLVARGCLVVLALVTFAALVFRRVRTQRQAPAIVLFAVVAAATGLASFAKARVMIPLVPLRWAELVSPDRQSMTLDLDVVFAYLGCALPAFALALIVDTGRLWRWWAGGLTALALHLGLTIAWQREQAWLRATGIADTLALAGVATLLLLIAVSRRRAEATAPPLEEEPPDAPQVPELSAAPGPRAVAALAVLGALVASGFVVHDARAARVETHALAKLDRPIPLPITWRRDPHAPGTLAALFRRDGDSLYPPTLGATIEPLPDGDAAALMATLIDGAHSLPAFRHGPLLPWGQYLHGAVAVDFSFDRNLGNGQTYPATGTTAILPMGDGRALVMTLLADVQAREQYTWDLIVLAERLRGS